METAYQKKWRIEHKDLCKAARKRYYEKHKEIIREKARLKYDPKRNHEYYLRTKERSRKWFKDYYQQNKEVYKKRGQRYKLKMRYGITEAEYTNMLEEQDGLCYLCKSKSTKNLGVDHDHRTGKVRRLLCYRCNNCLGMVDDSIDLLLNMISYLKNYKG